MAADHLSLDHESSTGPPSNGPGAVPPGPFVDPPFHVVLVEPEIPNNTGNIGRTCVAVGAALHLIHPLGFDLSEKARRRAGLDYWSRLRVFEHPDWAEYERAAPAGRWFLTTKAPRTLYDARLAPGDHLVFGKETAGLPGAILAAYPDRLLSLPMVAGERSLNLATAVCAVLYEGVRQMLVGGGAGLDPSGRLTWRGRAEKEGTGGLFGALS